MKKALLKCQWKNIQSCCTLQVTAICVTSTPVPKLFSTEAKEAFRTKYWK